MWNVLSIVHTILFCDEEGTKSETRRQISQSDIY